MIRRLHRRFRRSDERGALLIIAIIIITVVALVTGALLTHSETSLRATVTLRDVARAAYAADGAAQVAINDLRTGYNVGSGEPNPWYYTNAVGTGCFGYDGTGGATTPKDTLILDNLIPKQSGETQSVMSAAVQCTPEDATGEQGSAVPINNANKPGNAILTLGTGGENGFAFKTNGSGAAFRVRGGVWSNSNIFRDNNGTLESTESIRAVTGCTPANAMVAPIVNCNASAAPDPNYPSDLDIAGTGIPALQTPPLSCPNGGTVTLSPGYYDDVNKLNALTDTNQDCFIHLQPGTYYFDFHSSSDPLYDFDITGNAGSEWRIGGRKTLVAGTLTSDTSVPGRCVNPIDDVNANGVQLIFGGDSRMVINANGQASAVEICGSYHASRPPIAIYGQKTGTAVPTTLSGGTALTTSGTPTVTPAGTDNTFTGATAAALQDPGNGVATWFRPSGGNPNVSRTITMNGFAPGTALPKGTVVTGAQLIVRHKAAQNNAGTASTITMTPTTPGSTALGAITLQRPGSLTTQTINLATDSSTTAQYASLQKQIHDNGYSGANFDFTASIARNLGNTATAELDAVRLELTYYVPQLRGQTTAAIPGNTVATVGGAPVIQALGNSTTLYIQGTSYVPLAKIDLSLNNIDESVFRFGVIARSLVVFETGSFSYPGAVIELPDNSPGFGFERTIVQLEVYLCPGVASGCTTSNGELTLEARVELHDDGGTPGPPHREVTVLSWSHKR
ncbi:hypothetical protein [Nocardioides bizhenqiangii]|uniref:Type 4 fimbrial biogenesis protein PilX N-terminal domain-containing protein n=1 Tax=Nocardioides bizhenqiangii TaxID=3095076 RepID=A0ABZ0ZPU6_9ACTN|nr:hypothetical protein [Nocardioides sp. HM61]WQQ26238.1 hypothetical protein SHK19_20030 [Nocardioides sp. HM61]